MKKIIKLFIEIILQPLKFIIKQDNYIILSSINDNIYSGNVRYLFEHLSSKDDFNVFWYTNNKKVKSHLKNRGYQYITLSNPIKLIYCLFKTKYVFNDGDSYINLFNIIDNINCKKICLFHGQGTKTTLEKNNPNNTIEQQIKRIQKFNYVNFPSKYSVEKIAKELYKLPASKIISIGYPRCDIFYKKNKSNIENVSHIFKSIQNKHSKIILYTPTWRPYKYRFPILNMPGFTFAKFNTWLKANNHYFAYTLHPNSLMISSIPSDTSNIKFINTSKMSVFDINEFMLEVDVLINDYSTTSTDFSLLNKPQLFFMPDYEKYRDNKGFLTDFRSEMPGKEVMAYSELIDNLAYINSSRDNYLSDFKDKIDNIISKYHSVKKGGCSEEYYDFIKNNN